MANKRRRFGLLRKLPSGRYQASYTDPDGTRRPAPETFATKRAAEQWLSAMETELLRGEWTNPDLRRDTLRDFGSRWIEERPGLRPRTLDLYRLLFRKHIEPYLGSVGLGDLDTGRVRQWRSRLLDKGVSATVTAKAYRLLRAILMTAVDDGILIRNPCRIRGAGAEHAPERPVLTVAQVFDLAGRLPDPYGLMALVATFGSLRWGEVTGLRRRDVIVEAGALRISSALSRRYSGKAERGPVKSRAGDRVVALPKPIMDALVTRLDEKVKVEECALIFTGDKGGPISRNNFNKRVDWAEHVKVIGVPGLHFHDLRHTGNTLAAESGASLRDLMTRMGHDSMRAALIYQHRTQGADRRIADAMEDLIDRREEASEPAAEEANENEDADEDTDDDPDDGAAGALVRAG
jgi:integrase